MAVIYGIFLNQSVPVNPSVSLRLTAPFTQGSLGRSRASVKKETFLTRCAPDAPASGAFCMIFEILRILWLKTAIRRKLP